MAVVVGGLNTETLQFDWFPYCPLVELGKLKKPVGSVTVYASPRQNLICLFIRRRHIILCYFRIHYKLFS